MYADDNPFLSNLHSPFAIIWFFKHGIFSEVGRKPSGCLAKKHCRNGSGSDQIFVASLPQLDHLADWLSVLVCVHAVLGQAT